MRSDMGKKDEKRDEAPVQRKSVKVVFGDGMAPTRGPGGVLNVRSPYQLNIPPNTIVSVDVGIKFSRPTLVFQTAGLRLRKVEFAGETPAQAPDNFVFDADSDVVVRLVNRGVETALIEPGDTIARAFVLEENDLLVV
jgi:hypothetical protein